MVSSMSTRSTVVTTRSPESPARSFRSRNACRIAAAIAMMGASLAVTLWGIVAGLA